MDEWLNKLSYIHLHHGISRGGGGRGRGSNLAVRWITAKWTANPNRWHTIQLYSSNMLEVTRGNWEPGVKGRLHVVVKGNRRNLCDAEQSYTLLVVMITWIYAYDKNAKNWASLVVHQLRIRLPTQGIQVQSLVQEDATCHGATKPRPHNYLAWVIQLLKPKPLLPMVHIKRSDHDEKPTHSNEE